MNFMNWSTDNLHHAYICVGDKEQVKEYILSFIENDLDMNIKGNPDIRVEQYKNFGIDDAHRINSAQLKKSIDGGKMIFVLVLDGATMEAQNSLLKMFEEPTSDTHFFIITTTSDIFLPTLLSRVELIEYKSTTDKETVVLVDNFLNASKVKRIELLKEIIEEKDKAGALKLLNALEKSVYQKKGLSEVETYEVINLCRRYINDRGASVKILMEYLALSI